MTNSNDDWGGVICPGCGNEVYRIVEGNCLPCLRRFDAEEKDQEEQDQKQDEKNQKLQKKYKKWGLNIVPKKKKSPLKRGTSVS